MLHLFITGYHVPEGKHLSRTLSPSNSQDSGLATELYLRIRPALYPLTRFQISSNNIQTKPLSSGSGFISMLLDAYGVMFQTRSYIVIIIDHG